ncbi:hypothetical protein GBA52_015298 [Prunus armeniaca]|nr:hypothetical protein GBA52_015298 [Prunus armeniaca]
MGNSPIKLLVPGELILAKVEEKEMVFRAIHHVEKDQPPMYRTIFLPRKGGPPYDATDGCPKCKG